MITPYKRSPVRLASSQVDHVGRHSSLLQQYQPALGRHHHHQVTASDSSAARSHSRRRFPLHGSVPVPASSSRTPAVAASTREELHRRRPSLHPLLVVVALSTVYTYTPPPSPRVTRTYSHQRRRSLSTSFMAGDQTDAGVAEEGGMHHGGMGGGGVVSLGREERDPAPRSTTTGTLFGIGELYMFNVILHVHCLKFSTLSVLSNTITSSKVPVQYN